ncbi:hypothetical protein [Pandoraea sp.]|uniref:hypothetical protein n=1 Tax=Pandoraea sp. TaxID=1883445 RepID=UPI0035B1F573
MAGAAGAVGTLDGLSAPPPRGRDEAVDALGATAATATATTADDVAPGHNVRPARGETPGWINGALVLGTAIFAAIALLGIWWNLRAPYVDPMPKPPGGLTITPFNTGNGTLPVSAAGNAPVAASERAASEVSAALAGAQAAVDAAASGAAADAASASAPAPLTASAATAALTAAATAPPPGAARHNAPDDMMQLLSRRGTGGAPGSSARPVTNADLPAHYDNNDIGAIAAEAQHAEAPAALASAPSAANTVAAALAQCDRYRWYEVIPKQRCVWAVCNGRWGKNGCPAGANPGEAR